MAYTMEELQVLCGVAPERVWGVAECLVCRRRDFGQRCPNGQEHVYKVSDLPDVVGLEDMLESPPLCSTVRLFAHPSIDKVRLW